MRDRLTSSLFACIEDALPLMHDQLSQNRAVFVHCEIGKSRSPSLCIAYCLYYLKKNLQMCFERCRNLAEFQPNGRFLLELSKLEQFWGQEKKENVEANTTSSTFIVSEKIKLRVARNINIEEIEIPESFSLVT